MAEVRTYLMTAPDGRTWYANARLFRHRGTWAFKTDTFIYCKRWGFRSSRAALIGASRYMKQYGNGRLLRKNS